MKVYVIARPIMNWKEFGKFQMDEKTDWQYYGEGGITGGPQADAEHLVELCGRLCYMSFGRGRKTTKEYLANIINHRHFSVLEHANWTIFITGISRSLTHELIRHRHFSYSQLSQRFVDHKDFPFHIPQEIKDNETLLDLWNSAFDHVKEVYETTISYFRNQNAVSLKKKELHTIARAVLPNAIETKIAVTGNARAWREFIQKRLVPDADPEIRELADLLLKTLHNQAPLLFADLKEAVANATC